METTPKNGDIILKGTEVEKGNGNFQSLLSMSTLSDTTPVANSGASQESFLSHSNLPNHVNNASTPHRIASRASRCFDSPTTSCGAHNSQKYMTTSQLSTPRLVCATAASLVTTLESGTPTSLHFYNHSPSDRSRSNFSYFSAASPQEALHNSTAWQQPFGVVGSAPSGTCGRSSTCNSTDAVSDGSRNSQLEICSQERSPVSSAMSSPTACGGDRLAASAASVIDARKRKCSCEVVFETLEAPPVSDVLPQSVINHARAIANLLLAYFQAYEPNESIARFYAAEVTKAALVRLGYSVKAHPSFILRQRLQSGELQPTQSIGGPNFSAPSVLAHPAEFKNPSSFLKVYGDPMCANGMGAKTPLRGAHGNWTCQKCDCVNFPRRFRCNKCETYRDAIGDEVVSTYAKYVYESHLKTYQSIGAKAKPYGEVPPSCSVNTYRRGINSRKRRDCTKQQCVCSEGTAKCPTDLP